jgi:hypothetical protein
MVDAEAVLQWVCRPVLKMVNMTSFKGVSREKVWEKVSMFLARRELEVEF